MLWLRKRRDAAAEAMPDVIAPAELPVQFDEERFRSHMTMLLEVARVDGGVDTYLEALGAKQRLFSEVLAEGAIDALDHAGLEALLEAVFTARRKLQPVIAELGPAATAGALRDLLHGIEPVAARMSGFVARLPIRDGEGREARGRAARLRRAAHDFAAESLHFIDPVRYPLMARWVWDDATSSGALREFVHNPDQVDRLALDNRPETFEAARTWIAGEIEAQGIYRDVPLWVDLVEAAAYTQYFRSMTGGVLGSDFSRTGGPEENLKKLLGIEAGRRGGKSRVVRV
ncbi:MAG: hypothetical protein LJE97_17705 [Betaproteobacteria bacterium]|jgi:hypothetical protein|nr:hypothetical protein [Betaproteobacteria bacterium]